ncbi:ecdysone 20-monooxygenase isoform X1 [Phlebotomus papatasi]|nr:ecdysone 20-monooxygenase isoform X1 [Phlebotomus papatasi]
MTSVTSSKPLVTEMSVTLILIYIVAAFVLCLFFRNNLLHAIIKYKQLETSQVTNDKDIYNIPGPTRFPIVGTKWIYFWHYKLNQLHSVYKDLNRRYGRIVLEVGDGIPVVHLFAKQDIEKVLKYPSKYPFRPPSEIFVYHRKARADRYSSCGIVNEQGETWHKLRCGLTPNLTSPRILIGFLPILNEICDDFIELIKIKRNEDNIIVNFQELVNALGLEALCALLLGRRMGFLAENPSDQVKNLASAVKALFITQRDSFFGTGLWKYLPTKTWRDFVRSEDTIYETISSIVDKALDDEKREYNDLDVRNIFYSILSTPELDVKDKKSGIIDLMTAGVETLAHTLAFLLQHLSQNSTSQLQIADEFRNCPQILTMDNLAEAMYTKACIQESYRLSPTTFAIARVIEDTSVSLSGYNLRAGTFVLCHTMIACHSEENFRYANHFLPERWITAGKDNSRFNLRHSPNLVLPFGIGRRSCPGKRFVDMELTLLIAKIIRSFQVEYCSEFDATFEFLLAPKTPVNIRFCDRR